MDGFVYIIESPSDTDLLDSRTEGGILRESFRLAGIPHAYNLVTTRASFEDALSNRLAVAIAKRKVPPILHFSMHGSEQGIALTDGTFLQWSELKGSVAPLMNYMQGALIICMSSCYGISALQLAMTEEDHPFWSLITHSNKADWADAAVAFTCFYHLLFKGNTVDHCVNTMRAASGDNRFGKVDGHEIQETWVSYVRQRKRNMMADVLRHFSDQEEGNGER